MGRPGDINHWRSHLNCFLACFVVLIAPFQYGADFGLIGGLQAMPGFLKIYGYPAPHTPIGWNLSPLRQQLISSLMTLGAFISAATAGFAAIKAGRRQCLWLAVLLCCIATIIMMATEDFGALCAGRLIIGLANGYFMTFSQLYIQESSPAKYRGLFLTAFSAFTSLGTLLGSIVDWATAPRPDKSAYLIPLGMIYIIPFIMTISMFFIPESPRWLILQGRLDEGRKALLWLRPDAWAVEEELAEIKAAIDRESEMGSSVGFMDMFRNPVDRRRTFLSVAAVTLQAASGSMFIIAYKTYFLGMAKVPNPFAMSNILSAMGILAIIFNSLIVVRFGSRRNVLMIGFAICGLFQLIIAVVYDKEPGTTNTGNVIVAFTCLYMMTYNGMIATYAWLAGGEIPSQRLRSYTFGMAAAVGFFFAWLTTFTAPYFINPDSLNWSAKYGYIWFPSCFIGLVFVFMFLPETKGRTLEEIDEMFEARLGARKFRGHVCVNAGLAAKGNKDIPLDEEEGKDSDKTKAEAIEKEVAVR